MAYKEFGATIAPANISGTGFPIAMGSHIGGGRIVNGKSTLNSKHWCLLGEGATLSNQKANAIGQIWYDTSDSKYWKLDSWSGTDPVWVDVSTIFATKSYVDSVINDVTLTSSSIISALGYTPYSSANPNAYTSNTGTVTGITLNATSPILIDSSAAIATSGTRTFSHASTSGNKHIPSGGTTNQLLRWSADGTATWSNEVTYGVFNTTTDGLVPKTTTSNTTDYLRRDGTWVTPPNSTTHLYVGASGTNTNGTTTNGNTYIKLFDDTTAREQHKISGNGPSVVTSDATGNIIVGISDNSIGATQLNVTGNGTTTQYLRSDGDGSFTWADIPILNQDTTGSAGSVVYSATFNNAGTGAVSGTTYNGSTARVISYNTIGAVPSGRVITAGDGLTGGGDLTANRTLTLGTPGTLNAGTTNSVTSTSHTHAINFPNFYNAEHKRVPSDDFDNIWGFENNVWLCQSRMYNGVGDDFGNLDPNPIDDYEPSVLIQYGIPGKKMQMLFIHPNVQNVIKEGIFYRFEDNPNAWLRMLDTTDYDNLYNSLVQWVTNNFEPKQTTADMPAPVGAGAVITITDAYINKLITTTTPISNGTVVINYWKSYLETEIHLKTGATVPALSVDGSYEWVNVPGTGLMPNTTYIIAIKNGVITFAKSI